MGKRGHMPEQIIGKLREAGRGACVQTNESL